MKAAAWSHRWMRELSWRHIQRLLSGADRFPPETDLEKSRVQRLKNEWQRRKREGGGGLVAASPKKILTDVLVRHFSKMPAKQAAKRIKELAKGVL